MPRPLAARNLPIPTEPTKKEPRTPADHGKRLGGNTSATACPMAALTTYSARFAAQKPSTRIGSVATSKSKMEFSTNWGTSYCQLPATALSRGRQEDTCSTRIPPSDSQGGSTRICKISVAATKRMNIAAKCAFESTAIKARDEPGHCNRRGSARKVHGTSSTGNSAYFNSGSGPTLIRRIETQFGGRLIAQTYGHSRHPRALSKARADMRRRCQTEHQRLLELFRDPEGSVTEQVTSTPTWQQKYKFHQQHLDAQARILHESTAARGTADATSLRVDSSPTVPSLQRCTFS